MGFNACWLLKNANTKRKIQILWRIVQAPETDGSIDPNKLPKTLPGYLIKLNSEFNIDGETLHTAGTMGSEMHEEMGLYSPKEGWSTGIKSGCWNLSCHWFKLARCKSRTSDTKHLEFLSCQDGVTLGKICINVSSPEISWHLFT